MIENISKFNRYHNLNSHDIIKIVAIVAMAIDHLGLYVFQEVIALRVIGRFAMPLFFFLIGSSCHWKNKQELYIAAIIAEICKYFLHGCSSDVFPLNILFAVILYRPLFGLAAKYFKGNLHIWFIVIFASISLSLFTNKLTDYGTLVILPMTIGYLSQLQIKHKAIFCVAVASIYALIEGLSFGFSSIEIILLIVSGLILAIYGSSYHLVSYGTSKFYSVIKFLARYSLEFYVIHLGIIVFLYPISPIN